MPASKRTRIFKVRYTVQFVATVVVEAGQDREDAFNDIDIPEGGNNRSQYETDTFEIDDYKEEK